jgi:hypothetical protein
MWTYRLQGELYEVWYNYQLGIRHSLFCFNSWVYLMFFTSKYHCNARVNFFKNINGDTYCMGFYEFGWSIWVNVNFTDTGEGCEFT